MDIKRICCEGADDNHFDKDWDQRRPPISKERNTWLQRKCEKVLVESGAVRISRRTARHAVILVSRE
jgi:hypothetical protein